jgi:plasmid maintenance system antidote protein VapI
MAVRLEQALGATANPWLRMPVNYDLVQILGRAPRIRVNRLATGVA